jgi:thiol:disulfide interchange protein DsbC
VELGRKYKITGTPTLLFVNGARIPGAVDSARVEQALADTSKL